jgi:DNA mismatch endonuclease (patch repair protein)
MGTGCRLVDRGARRHRKMQRPSTGRTAPGADVPVSPARSANMSRIGQKDTAPELAVRRLLHRLGARFRLHRRDLPGTPDIVLPGRRLVILVHGCFWHRHPGCRFAYMPKTRIEFWRTKFARNVMRDRAVEKALSALDWRVHVIWECETHDKKTLSARLAKILSQKGRRRSNKA